MPDVGIRHFKQPLMYIFLRAPKRKHAVRSPFAHRHQWAFYSITQNKEPMKCFAFNFAMFFYRCPCIRKAEIP